MAGGGAPGAGPGRASLATSVVVSSLFGENDSGMRPLGRHSRFVTDAFARGRRLPARPCHDGAMSARIRTALGQALTMAVVMVLLRRLGTLLPYEWAQETFTRSLVFGVLFGIVWGVITYVMYPREQERKAERRRGR